ncbi:MAG: hypothetical protein P857_1027 [Candidatus Xenolissoclinum pacificiensis L6]|uniref:SHOCT-like domain-containing protein n=1 Tax=Candidatus Xenolissoclinum pacificiensis L6 TaxID=1401685 RepID=W2V0R3_9RICK|nr:MAG: hypothetical protein P857_1027 [Candidatus Xenolissoclinum pacificiensis L6]
MQRHKSNITLKEAKRAFEQDLITREEYKKIKQMLLFAKKELIKSD